VLNHYIEHGGLFTRHFEGTWQDAGTIESLLQAGMVAAGHAPADAADPGVAARAASR
jgi:hypothetical protein